MESYVLLFVAITVLLVAFLVLVAYFLSAILGVLRQIRDQQIADSVSAEDARA